MRKSIFYFSAVMMSACSCLTNAVVQPTEYVQPTETPSSTVTVTPTITLTPSLEATATVATGFTIVRVYPSDGDLNEQLAAEVAKAKALGQDAYVEFDATWCPCCQAIEASLDEANALMVDAFQGVYVVRADVDAWREYLDGTGFEFDAIPIFFQLNDQGRPTGEWIDGNAWGENIPENMAPPLKEFFQSH
ncbi:MAG: thioredoxin domain-containing protein [Anaerolineales bacterium]